MNAKTELLLYRMEWLVSKALAPTYRNMAESFEGWAYSRGLLAQINRLEAQGLLESASDPRTGKRVFGEDDPECSRLLLLLAESKGPRTGRNIVAAAWDFEAINRHYRDYLATLAQAKGRGQPSNPEEWASWTELECRSWKQALAADPLLPNELLPAGYLGKTALRQRQQTLAAVAEVLTGIRPSGPA